MIPSLSVDHGTVETVNEAPALFPAETKAAVEQTGPTNYLKPTGTSTSLRPSSPRVNSSRRASGVYRQPRLAPQSDDAEQIVNGDRQIMVRVHQPRRRHDAMTHVVLGRWRRPCQTCHAALATRYHRTFEEQSIRIAPSLSRCIKRISINLIVN